MDIRFSDRLFGMHVFTDDNWARMSGVLLRGLWRLLQADP